MHPLKRLETQLVAAVTQKKPKVPEAGRLLWQWFIDLNDTRTHHAAGPNPISFSEIAEYSAINRWPLQPHHVEIIRAMDRAFLRHAYAQAGASGQTPSGPAQPVNVEAFDAVFG